MARQNDLGRDPIGKLVMRIALPSMLAQFVNVLYSIVDRMYIGHIAGVGDLSLAGVGICGPVIALLGAFGSLIGVGGSPLMSMCMGEGKTEEAKHILANCFLMLCVVSVGLVCVLLPIQKPMLLLFGASDATLPYAGSYFSIYLMGTFFALMATGLCPLIICQGFSKQAMTAVLLGAVTNIVLDPLFIFVFDMGVAGAALATVAAQFLSCAYALCFLFGKRVPVRISFGGYRLSIAKRVLSIGFTPFAIISVDSAMIIAMNAVLQRYGGAAQGDALITCATIAQSFMLIVTMPLGGISSSTQTILGFNYGARQIDRVEAALKRIFQWCIGFTALMMVCAWTCDGLFVRLFTQDVQLMEKARWAIRVCTLAIIPLGIQYEAVDSFTAIGQVRYSLLLSFFRKAVYFAALFALPAIWGAEATFYAEPVSDVIGPAFSFAVHSVAMRRVLNRRRTELTKGAEV